MYKKILVPLDGSKRAERILPHVDEIATRFGSEIIFLRVAESAAAVLGAHVDTPGMYLNALQSMRQEAKDYLQALNGEYRQRGLKTRLILEEGPVVSKIIQIAKSEEVDLIAMASHGRTGFSRVFYGSVSAGILNQVDRPLLLVRSED